MTTQDQSIPEKELFTTIDGAWESFKRESLQGIDPVNIQRIRDYFYSGAQAMFMVFVGEGMSPQDLETSLAISANQMLNWHIDLGERATDIRSNGSPDNMENKS